MSFEQERLKYLDSALGRREVKLALIGMGYVGLPLAVEFGKRYATIGFDIKESRLEELREGVDSTLETSSEDLRAAKRLSFTSDPADLSSCDVFIVTVPTPIDKYNRPDLGPLLAASKSVGSVMKPGSIVVYESTVFPDVRKECVRFWKRARGWSSIRISSAAIRLNASIPATRSTA